jgi:hypothetical protein
MPDAGASAGPSYIQILVAVVPVILSPMIAWALSRSRVSKESATIEYLSKRLDFLERLNKLHSQLAEGPIKPFLDMEIEHCRAFLGQQPIFLRHGAETEGAAVPQSRWGRFFLTQPAVSVRRRIFKGLFYFFFGIAMSFLVLAPITLSESRSEFLDLAPIFLFSFVFYLVIALLSRHFARPPTATPLGNPPAPGPA